MTPNKFRLKYVSPSPELCRGAITEEVLQEIKFSKHCFVLYSPYNAPTELLFTGLNEPVLIDFLVMMGQRPELFEFLKLAVISHEKLSKSGKQGMELINRVIKHIKNNFEDFNERFKDSE